MQSILPPSPDAQDGNEPDALDSPPIATLLHSRLASWFGDDRQSFLVSDLVPVVTQIVAEFQYNALEMSRKADIAEARAEGSEAAIERARDVLDGWEQDGPDDPAMRLLIQRVREALDDGGADDDNGAALCPCGELVGHANHCGSCCGCGAADQHEHMATIEHLRRCPICDMRFARADECDHDWLDRPESDTRECLICGTEVSG